MANPTDKQIRALARKLFNAEISDLRWYPFDRRFRPDGTEIKPSASDELRNRYLTRARGMLERGGFTAH